MDMTMLAPHDSLVTGPSGVRSRSERRAALDVSIDEELLRGVLRSTGLTAVQRRTLTTLVDNELAGTAPISERSLRAGRPLTKLFGQTSSGVVDALVQMGLVRRVDGAVRVRVAGCAIVMPAREVPRDLLRGLRETELRETTARGIRF